MSWFYFLIGLGCISCVFVLIISCIKYKKAQDELDSEEQTVEDFIKAKEVFVRDPLDFKDKDSDGVDDVVDKNI